jgi:hypothetical protein
LVVGVAEVKSRVANPIYYRSRRNDSTLGDFNSSHKSRERYIWSVHGDSVAEDLGSSRLEPDEPSHSRTVFRVSFLDNGGSAAIQKTG